MQNAKPRLSVSPVTPLSELQQVAAVQGASRLQMAVHGVQEEIELGQLPCGDVCDQRCAASAARGCHGMPGCVDELSMVVDKAEPQCLLSL